MSRVRIKICGITRAEDAIAAAEAGVDAIGMVLHAAAPRRINSERAKEIVAVLPPFVSPIGLFVDAHLQVITEALKEFDLAMVQLHGHEPPEFIARLKPIRVIKAIRVDKHLIAEELKKWRQAVVSLELTNLAGLVLETAGTKQPGGSGVENDWDTVLHHQEAGDFAKLPPLIASGGLTPANVGKVIGQLQPWAVDVSTGVEQSIGIKSADKIRDFVNAVEAAGEN